MDSMSTPAIPEGIVPKTRITFHERRQIIMEELRRCGPVKITVRDPQNHQYALDVALDLLLQGVDVELHGFPYCQVKNT